MRSIAMLLVFVFFIAGCGDKPTQRPSGFVPLESQGNEKAVIVSRSEQFGKVNPGVFGTFTEQQAIEDFEAAFRSAEKINGILDIDFPEYDVVFEAADGSRSSYHLWIGQRQEAVGMYTTTEDTGQGYRLSQDASRKLRDMISALSLGYTSERAAANGDVVDLHEKVLGAERLERFADNLKNGVADIVHVTSYTVEGAPIFSDLNFDGTYLRFTYDTTMDGYGGSPSRASTFCEGLSEADGRYELTGCDHDDIQFKLTLP